MAEDDSRDERVFAVIEDLSQQLREGKIPDLQSVADAHPDLADDLRELWGAILFAEEAARTTNTRLVSAPQGVEAISELDDAPSRVATLDSLPRRFGDYDILGEVAAVAWGSSMRLASRVSTVGWRSRCSSVEPWQRTQTSRVFAPRRRRPLDSTTRISSLS